MNAYYHYKYQNGLQFVSTAPLDAIKEWVKLEHKKYNTTTKEQDYPIVLGVWRLKELKNKNEKN